MIRRRDVGVERGANGRQLRAESTYDVDGTLLCFGGRRIVPTLREPQFKLHLVQQGVQGRPDSMADVEVFHLRAQVQRTQPHRKKRAAEVLDDLPQAFLRRKLAAAGVAQAAERLTPLDTYRAQVGDDAVEIPADCIGTERCIHNSYSIAAINVPQAIRGTVYRLAALYRRPLSRQVGNRIGRRVYVTGLADGASSSRAARATRQLPASGAYSKPPERCVGL